MRLPEEEDGLEEAARHYYGSASLLPVAGSQAAIQTLPHLRTPGRVGVLAPAYTEHAHAWKQAGHTVEALAPETLLADPGHLPWEVLVVINPNNPTGHRFSPARLLVWHERLSAHGGWLVVDEAFMDVSPHDSLAAHCPTPGLIVLRSLGKFFGLAGARVGFVLAESKLLETLRHRLGPWAVNAPARWVATRALSDCAWHMCARRRLLVEGERLAELLGRFGWMPAGGCALFQWVLTPDAATLHESLARRGILVRSFDDPPSLRFGLPGSEVAWSRLENALAEIMVGEGPD